MAKHPINLSQVYLAIVTLNRGACMKFIWEKLKAYKKWALVTVPNRYMGLVLLLMLLVIYLK
jgi:hypothetical protein